jgi:RHS repeat-associated protein
MRVRSRSSQCERCRRAQSRYSYDVPTSRDAPCRRRFGRLPDDVDRRAALSAEHFRSVSPNRTKFTYVINRYYDPTTDQFISVDPLAALTGQPYAFAGDDPVNSSDPLGDIATNQFGQGCGEVVSDCNQASSQEDADCPTSNPTCGSIPPQGPPTAYGDTGGASLAAVVNPVAGDSAPKAQPLSDLEAYGPICGVSCEDAEDGSYVQLCFAYVGVFCVSFGGKIHVSVGIGLGTPGITASGGRVSGATGDQYLCGESVSAGGNYVVGGEVGKNPGAHDIAGGPQFGTPGVGAYVTYGLLNC